MEKTLAEVVDELSVVNIKLYHLVERVERGEHSLEDASKIQTLNRLRSALKNAISEHLGQRVEVKV